MCVGVFMDKERFFSEIHGKTIGFCGVGRSNLPLIKLFIKKGAAAIIVRDKREDLGENNEKLKLLGVKTVLGENYLKDITEDILFRAPGVPFTLPEFKAAREKGCVITSEMELFFELCPCKTYGITGSDGKTTTTSIIAEFLKAEGKRVHLGGNIGKPLLPLIEDISPLDVAVAELSSFQLISMRKGPDVALITNLAPNHLDVHRDMEEYIGAKKNILSQNAFSRTVLNLDNQLTADLCLHVRGDLWGFSRKTEPARGVWAKDGKIYVCGRFLMNTKDIKIPGNHNVENYLAAISAVWGEVSPENIIKVARTFGGVAHRAEFVREYEGVKYYNDSIASSPSRAMSGTLSLYKNRIIMIAGGADKGVGFEELGEIICKKVKVLILIKPEEQLPGCKPSAADKLSTAVTSSKAYFDGNPLIIRVNDMEQAVAAARETAREGDTVSLCPACTAFDMYQSFEVRGDHYKELVMKMSEFDGEESRR